MRWLLDRFKDKADRVAINDSSGEYSYGNVLSQVHIYSKELGSLFSAGTCVAILSDYNFFAIALLLAAVERKLIVVPVAEGTAKEAENRIQVGQCDAVIHIVDGGLQVENLEQSEKHPLIGSLIDNKRSGLILFSSGSTGEPKAMIHDMDNFIDKFRHKKHNSLTLLIFLLFDHIGGLNTLISSLAMCTHIIIPQKRDADHVAALIEKHKVNILPTSPTFINLMLMSSVNERYDMASLRLITFGTEPMPESLLQNARKAFPRARFLQTYGTSETGIVKTSNRSSDSLKIKIDDLNMEYKVVSGELYIRSKTQILGYLNASMDNFTDDHWFKTGDVVEESSDGCITIVGRNKEVINVGGEKVLPTEVESVLLQHEFVLDALVKGVKNALTGQSVLAEVLLKTDVDRKEAKKMLRRHCIESMASYKVPTKFIFVDAINHGSRFKKMRLS